MKAKRYIGILALALMFFGICRLPIASPNQVILVRFNPDEVTTEQSRNVIEAIAQQLQSFGAQDVFVHQSDEGELRILYRSTISAEDIKLALSDNNLDFGITAVGHGASPQKTLYDDGTDYQLYVYELYKTLENNNSAGKFVVVVKQDYDRFLNSNFYPSVIQLGSELPKDIREGHGKISNTDHIIAEIEAHIIPEVRAGPGIFSNS
ncbi:MAG TPA: hypothetical protein PKL92_02065 [Aquaticitalea sp.]|nr:hypothetical protein [Aquaticitalea sp.]